MISRKILGLAGGALAVVASVGYWTNVPWKTFETVVLHMIPPATVLYQEEDRQCWRVMDWTSRRLVYCDTAHPLPADREVVDVLARERWLRRYGS